LFSHKSNVYADRKWKGREGWTSHAAGNHTKMDPYSSDVQIYTQTHLQYTSSLVYSVSYIFNTLYHVFPKPMGKE